MINIGAVSYLNSTPLIDGLEDDDRLHVVTDVPSRLLGELLAGRVDVALCPVIDYQMSPEPLRVVPVARVIRSWPTTTGSTVAPSRPLNRPLPWAVRVS